MDVDVAGADIIDISRALPGIAMIGKEGGMLTFNYGKLRQAVRITG